MDWPKSPCVFFRKVEDTFFIFTNKFIDLDILTMSSISCEVYHWLFSINVSTDFNHLQLVYLTMEHCPARNLHHETLQTIFDMFNPPQHLLSTLCQSFSVFLLCFYLYEMIKHNMLKMCIFFNIQYSKLKGYTKIHQVWWVFYAHWYDGYQNTT